jgi:Zn-dependent protease with chaperone function
MNYCIKPVMAWMIAAASLAVLFAQGAAAQTGKTEEEGGSAEDRRLFHNVMDRLLQTQQVRANYPAALKWPPKTNIVPNSAKVINAFAGTIGKDPKSDKILAQAVVTEGYMSKIVDGSDDVLAAVMGHELAHITKGHLASEIKADLLGLGLSREQEIDADLEGVKIAVAAGFPYRSGIRNAFRGLKALGDYSNFEGIRGTHPSWTDRLAMLDREQAQLWQAMAAFHNGYFFLHAEQYPAAENCFQQVVDDFPDCSEAWANLGYARLMQYCDSLDEQDVRKLKIGQIVAGCFYAQAKSLTPSIRGDRKKWEQAVNTLNTVVSRHPDLVLARANLGLAYLVHPEGAKPAEALKHFAQAYKGNLAGADDLSTAALLVNYGVAEMANGNNAAAAEKFRQAGQALRKARPSPILSQLDLALLYNEAVIADGGNRAAQEKAFMELQEYLTLVSPDSAWWKRAQEHYVRLGTALQKKVLPSETLAKRFGDQFFRLVTTVEPAPGKLVTLSDPTVKVLKLLARENSVGVPVYQRSTIKRYNGISPGMDILARDIVVAVFLNSPEAPPVVVQLEGIGTSKKELRVGMPLTKLKEILKGQPEQDAAVVVDPAVRYVFLPFLGLAYRAERDRVAELVVAPVARKSNN